MVTIVDYQAGNIGSIGNMFKKLGVPTVVTSDRAVVAKAQFLVLPGVGAFDYGMTKLRELGLIDVLRSKAVEEKVPVLGICLGAQLMCNKSEEGKLEGLAWVDAEVKKFSTTCDGVRYRVPHMGWEHVTKVKNSKLLAGLPDPSRFYFVHSYYIECHNPDDVVLSNRYGVSFTSGFERDNIIGVQFHPEKSHNFGKQLLKNFLEYNAQTVLAGR